jgi:hypothetical protein
VQTQTATVGVLTVDTMKDLKDEEVRLMTAIASMETQAGAAPSLLDPTRSGMPYVDWSAGSKWQGLGAEPSVLRLSYPGATKLPENFPGYDFLQGGQRTPMVGTWRGLPQTDESFFASGGTLIQLKTLKNGPSTNYMNDPRAIFNELKKGMDKMENTFGPGKGRAERVGGEYFRVQHAGNPDRKIMHVVLEQAPTPEQAAALADTEAAAQSLQIELVWTAPPQRPVIEMAPGTASGALGVGVGLLGVLGRNKRTERELATSGYMPPGDRAYESENPVSRAGSFLRGESNIVQGDFGQTNVPVWRANIKRICDAKPVGGTVTYGAYNDKGDRYDFKFVKDPDGRWRVIEGPTNRMNFAPNINRIIDLRVDDATVIALSGPGA